MAALFFIVFLDLVGFGMIIPVLPFYAEHLGIAPSLIIFFFGLYSVGQLVGAPLWGALSDRLGRRPVLLATLAANAAADPIIDVEELPQFAADYLAGADPRNPFASPLYGDLAGLPPILIQAGSDEVLLDDSVRLAEGLRRANSPVDLHVWPRMFHGWQLFAPLLPESRQAIEQIGAFARRTLDTTAAASRLAR